MSHMSHIRLVVLFVLLCLSPLTAFAQVMADYSATPPFIPDTVPPNILLLMDNSGSMNMLAYQDAFVPTTTYVGLFDPLKCYSYASGLFTPYSTTNTGPDTLCSNSSAPWSGNLMNYATMRRIDLVKWALIGGACTAGTRDAQGQCTQLEAIASFSSTACCINQERTIPVSQLSGRIPSSALTGTGSLYFYLPGTISSLKGFLCIDNDSTNPTNTTGCNDTDPYTETAWQLRVSHPEIPTGVIQQVGNKARFGLMEFNSSYQGGTVLADIGSPLSTLIAKIDTTIPSTNTPLAESLYEATRYFAQVAPAFSGSDYSYTTPSRDPYYFASPTWSAAGTTVNCCRSFVLIFTDGEPTEDLSIPPALQDYGHGVHANHCTGATTASLCDGHKTNYANSGSHYLDDVAYFAHINDLRQSTIPVLNISGSDLPGFQNLTTYTFYAFGETTGREILQTTAKLGGFEDRNGNQKPDLTEEWDRVNNYTGAAGSDGIPDTYFESENVDTLRDRLMWAITSMLQRSASGTAVSVMANSAEGDGASYQGYFFPSTFDGINEVRWMGYTSALFLDSFGNLREDTNKDGRLTYTDDAIVVTRYDTNEQNASYRQVVLDRYADLNGDGKADSTIPTTTGSPMTSLVSLWEAGERLALKSAASRVIRTWVDLNNNGLVDANEELDFVGSNATLLAPYLRAVATGTFTASNIINYIRGSAVSGMRNREISVPRGSASTSTWKLGDVVHSTPVVVDAPSDRFDLSYGDLSYLAYLQQYKHRRRVVYVGANDGMLHAFSGGFYHQGDDPLTTAVEHGWFTTGPTANDSAIALGDELWGYIPSQLLPQLQWLTRTDYTHSYYVDLTPRIADVRIFTPDATHPNGWGTILIGGFRLGGSCTACTTTNGAPPLTVTADFGAGTTETRTFLSAYFVLDITNPEVPPKLLWSFSDPGLGLTLNQPSVVRVNPPAADKTSNTSAGWYALFPSGPTGYGGQAGQTPALYAVSLTQGPGTANQFVTKFAADTAMGFLTTPTAIDTNGDYRADAVYVGSALTNGTTWSGKLHRLMLTCSSNPCLPSSWGIASGTSRLMTEVLSKFPQSQTLTLGPVTAQPAITMDDTRRVWLFVGTGRYLSSSDKLSVDPQYLVGVKDRVANRACTETSQTSCLADDLLDVTNARVCTVCASGSTQLSSISGATTVSALGGLMQSKDGWYLTLGRARERIVTPVTLYGGALLVPSFAPVNNLCDSQGESYLYGLYYLTGTPPSEPIIGTTPDGQDTIAPPSISIGSGGLQSAVSIHVGQSGGGSNGSVTTGNGCQSGSSGITQSSSGAITQWCLKTPSPIWSRYLSWVTSRS